MSIEMNTETQLETGPALTPLGNVDPTVKSAVAGPWLLFWHKLSRNRIALFAGGVVVLFYLVAIFAEFLAPGLPDTARPQYTYAPPQPLQFMVTETDGSRRFQLHVPGYSMQVDQASLRRTYVVDEAKVVPVGLFVEGPGYKLWGLIPMTRHLIGPLNPQDTMYLMGSDKLGRDLMTRLIYGTRISMSIGLVGVGISLFLGIALGSIAGFYGGGTDATIQRVIEVISSMPTIPLWLGLAAAVPVSWSPIQVYFMITLIIALLGWTGLAREVRGRFYALRTEDFVTAARLDGSSERRLIARHILPSLTSHILAVVTLALPTMIVAETALSFWASVLSRRSCPGVCCCKTPRMCASSPRRHGSWPGRLALSSPPCWPTTSSAMGCETQPILMRADAMLIDPQQSSSAAPSDTDTLLKVENLSVDFRLRTHILHAVRDVSFTLRRGRTLSLVGESGSGKSVTARTLLRIIDRNGTIVNGHIWLSNGQGPAVDIAALKEFASALRRIRGSRIGLIFQEPMSSLSPVHTIGSQIVEVLRLHQDMNRTEARERTIALLRDVEIDRAEEMIDRYTFEFSGGMRQRAMIAMALEPIPIS